MPKYKMTAKQSLKVIRTKEKISTEMIQKIPGGGVRIEYNWHYLYQWIVHTIL